MTSRPQRTRAEERIAELDLSPTALVKELEHLREQLTAAQQEAADSRIGWQRSAADFANYRRRTDEERAALVSLANEALLAKLLAVADDFDRALEALPPDLADLPWAQGIVAIDRKLRALLESEGVTPFEAKGQPFDPHQHEAIAQEETTLVPEGTVTAEIQRGYRLRDRVLRPALVAVSKHPDKHQHAGNGEATEN